MRGEIRTLQEHASKALDIPLGSDESNRFDARLVEMVDLQMGSGAGNGARRIALVQVYMRWLSGCTGVAPELPPVCQNSRGALREVWWHEMKPGDTVVFQWTMLDGGVEMLAGTVQTKRAALSHVHPGHSNIIIEVQYPDAEVHAHSFDDVDCVLHAWTQVQGVKRPEPPAGSGAPTTRARTPSAPTPPPSAPVGAPAPQLDTQSALESAERRASPRIRPPSEPTPPRVATPASAPAPAPQLDAAAPLLSAAASPSRSAAAAVSPATQVTRTASPR